MEVALDFEAAGAVYLLQLRQHEISQLTLKAGGESEEEKIPGRGTGDIVEKLLAFDCVPAPVAPGGKKFDDDGNIGGVFIFRGRGFDRRELFNNFF